jgi:hypothetical protein
VPSNVPWPWSEGLGRLTDSRAGGETNGTDALEYAGARKIAREYVGLAEVEQQDAASHSIVRRNKALLRERSGCGAGRAGCTGAC